MKVPGEIEEQPCDTCKRNLLKDNCCLDCGSDNGYILYIDAEIIKTLRGWGIKAEAGTKVC